MGYIYAISDPISGEIRYIGKTTQTIEKRFQQHLWDSNRKHRSYLRNWISNLLKNNLDPVIEIIEETDNSLLNQLEKYYIKLGRLLNYKLVNSTDGGDGLCNPTQEVRNKISATLKKLPPPSLETRRKISESKQGEKHPMYGKHHTKESLEKISTNRKGIPVSEETRKRMSDATKGKSKHFSEKSNFHSPLKYSPEKFVCPQCKIEFELSGSNLSHAKGRSKKSGIGPFCGVKCAGIFGREVRYKDYIKIKDRATNQ